MIVVYEENNGKWKEFGTVDTNGKASNPALQQIVNTCLDNYHLNLKDKEQEKALAYYFSGTYLKAVVK